MARMLFLMLVACGLLLVTQVGATASETKAIEPSAAVREPSDAAKPYLRSARWSGGNTGNAEFDFVWDPSVESGLRISKFTFAKEDLTKYVRIEWGGRGITIVCDSPTRNFRIENLFYNGKFLTGTVRVGDWSTDAKFWPE